MNPGHKDSAISAHGDCAVALNLSAPHTSKFTPIIVIVR
jgi:hypothetical protein